MTNREAWKKGYEHGFKGLHPRPDYPLVGLAGSYRLGYEAGYKRRQEPKGPKQKRNPNFLSHAIAKHKVKEARKRVQAEIARVRNRIAELEQEVIEYRHGPIWKGDSRAKQWAAQASLKAQKLRAMEKRLVKGLQELPVINPRRNGIIEAAAGLQALDYFGGKAKRAGLGKKPKFNPTGEDRFLIQIVKATGGREQVTAATEKQAREIAASWYSRGASVTVVDRKKKTQTVYGKRNPSGRSSASRPKQQEWFVFSKGYRLGSVFASTQASARAEAAKKYPGSKALTVTTKRKNPRAKGSRDALGVFHVENPTLRTEVLQDAIRKSPRLGKIQRELEATIRAWKDFEEAVARAGTIKHKLNQEALDAFYRKARRLADQRDAEYETVKRRKNPSVTDLSRTFQGDADGSIDRLFAADGAPSDLARAGKLVFLKVKGKTFRIPGAMVAIAPNERLWITGKPPLFATKAHKGEGLDVGEVTHICYETAKAHIENGKTVEYVHEFGEDGGKRPHLIIDSEGMPILRGGDYKIRAEGIVN